MGHGLSCSVTCGIFPDKGPNSCPLHCRWNLIHCISSEVPLDVCNSEAGTRIGNNKEEWKRTSNKLGRKAELAWKANGRHNLKKRRVNVLNISGKKRLLVNSANTN